MDTLFIKSVSDTITISANKCDEHIIQCSVPYDNYWNTLICAVAIVLIMLIVCIYLYFSKRLVEENKICADYSDKLKGIEDRIKKLEKASEKQVNPKE